ncbi:MAG: DNA primase catalytic subunit PriS [Methanosarcinales archaeon]|nr:DNA primase catalytic subunit PriS [Methanosarcinales archaeon]
MNLKTVQFIKSRFQEHYRKDPVLSPPNLEQREWGFLMFDPASGMRRHKGFGSTREMQDYIASMVPAHVYHSAAYYDHPSAGTMKEKTWLGADLIFDIDADHLPVETDSFREMLDYAKQEIIKLICFLLDDFGFKEDNLHIAFSGGRGYHVHVRDPSILTLDSAQRREIVDYLSGTGLDIDHLFRKKYVVGDDKKSKTLEFPSQSQGGWGRLVNRKLMWHLQVLASDENAEQKLMEFKKIGKKKALKIIDALNSPEHLERLKNGKFDALSSIPAEFWDDALHQIVGGIQAYIDEPVTADIKRLIRAASSLHGKSGMKVVTLTVDELDNFEPLVDAVVFGDNEIMINVTKPTTVEMMDKEFKLEEGGQILPEYAAIYLMCRGGAEYAGGMK